MAVTLQTIAEHTGFSRSTVGHVLAGRGDELNISPDTQAQILQAAKSLGYRKGFMGQALRTGKADLVAIIGHAHQFHWREKRVALTAGLLRDRGYRVHLIDVEWDAGGRERATNELLDLNPLGVIFGEVAPMTAKYVEKLYQAGVPVVVGEGMPPEFGELPCDRIYLDREETNWIATKQMIDLGHRHLVCLQDPESTAWEVRQRLAGFYRAIKEAGLRKSNGQAFLRKAEDDLACGYASWAMAKDEFPKATAFLAANDRVAAGLMNAVLEDGVGVPDDISIMGAENEAFSAYMNPRMSTIAYPIEEMAQAAVDLLISRINGSRKALQTVRYVGNLIERATTAAYSGTKTSATRGEQ